MSVSWIPLTCVCSDISVCVKFLCWLFQAFPASCRQSHDTTYASIEKLLAKRTDCSSEDRQQLWRLVDPSKLSPAVNEAALNNPGFLSQPHILESVLQHHSEELSNVDVNDGQNLRHIMQKVINASLKLLEESSRHSNEVVAAEPVCRPARRQTARQL